MLAVTNYMHVLNLYTGLEQVLLYVGQLLILLFKKIQKKNKTGKATSTLAPVENDIYSNKKCSYY